MGVLLGDAFIHLIPDAVQSNGSVSTVCLTTLAGVFLFFLLEKGVRWRHEHTLPVSVKIDEIQPLAKMNLLGAAVHEIPQEIGDVGTLICGGFPPLRAVLYNFLCSLTVLAGVLFALCLGQVAESSLLFLLPIAAGGFIYIAASDLIPALHECSRLPAKAGQALTCALGAGFMQSIVIVESNLSSV